MRWASSRLALITLLVAVASLVVSACILGDDGGANSGSSTEDGVILDDVALRQYRDTLPEAQWRLLKDGRLSSADYEGAVHAYIQCAGEAGIDFIPEPRPNGIGLYTFNLTGAAPGSMAALASCEAEHLSVISLLWAQHVAESGTTQALLQDARDALGQCLRSRGATDVPEHPSGRDFTRFFVADAPDHDPSMRTSFFECQRQTASEFNLPGFAG